MACEMFSIDGYNRVLSAIVEHGYQAVTIPEIERGQQHEVIMRHDVDFCLDYARDMARLEATAGIRATYYVMLRSPMYNLFSRHNSALLREIVDLGHDIALHYDAWWTERQGGDHQKAVCFESKTLKELCGSSVASFSIHQPDSKILSCGLKAGGLVNVYDQRHFDGFTYISDSNRNWRGKDIFELLASGKNIQLLTHPMWWVCNEPTTEACWDRTIQMNFQSEQRQILETERAYGPPREIKVHHVDRVQPRRSD